MALVFEGMPCAICGHALDLYVRFVSTSHFIADEGDPLWRYSDAAMHSECFETWKHRSEFIDKYNNTIGQITWGNGTRHHMNADGSIDSIDV